MHADSMVFGACLINALPSLAAVLKAGRSACCLDFLVELYIYLLVCNPDTCDEIP